MGLEAISYVFFGAIVLGAAGPLLGRWHSLSRPVPVVVKAADAVRHPSGCPGRRPR
jgi:hypothetical protein